MAEFIQEKLEVLRGQLLEFEQLVLQKKNMDPRQDLEELFNLFQSKISTRIDGFRDFPSLFKHDFVLIDGIEIDTYIAPLIRQIWAVGIDTLNSCEENVPRGYIWIEFATSEDLREFLAIVFIDPESPAYNHAFGLEEYQEKCLEI